jgi:hypothetical protein
MASPALPEVYITCVPTVCLTDGTAEIGPFFWRYYQMDVIGHQAIAPDRDTFFATPLRDEIQILGVVLGMEKYTLTTISTLRDMVWVIREYHSC